MGAILCSRKLLRVTALDFCTAASGGAVGLLAVNNALLNASAFTNNSASTGAAHPHLEHLQAPASRSLVGSGRPDSMLMTCCYPPHEAHGVGQFQCALQRCQLSNALKATLASGNLSHAVGRHNQCYFSERILRVHAREPVNTLQVAEQ